MSSSTGGSLKALTTALQLYRAPVLLVPGVLASTTKVLFEYRYLSTLEVQSSSEVHPEFTLARGYSRIHRLIR